MYASITVILGFFLPLAIVFQTESRKKNLEFDQDFTSAETLTFTVTFGLHQLKYMHKI